MNNEITKAVEILDQGGIVIFPTDTAFGIGCRMDMPKSIAKLFKIRQRPLTQATPVLVSGIEMARNYLQQISPPVEKLMHEFWPGALTIVYPSQTEKVPELVRGGSSNIGVRQPNHETTLSLISAVGVPLLGPSANFHGEATPYTFESLDPNLIKLVDFVVSGVCSVGQASTVVDCSVTPWKILRRGSITLEKL